MRWWGNDMGNEKLFQFIIDNALEIFMSHDVQGNVIMMNHVGHEELGYYDLCNIKISDIIPETYIDSASGLADKMEYDGKAREMMVYRENMTCFRALIKGIITESECYPYVVMIKNISEQYSLEKIASKATEEAESASKVKNEFVANVTHELRTPVNGILGNTNILLENDNDSETQRILNIIKQSCDTMNNLINSILDFSKLEAGKFTLENRRFEFRSMIDYIKSTHMPKISEKGLQFFVTISPEVPQYIVGDELRIGQILNNLLSNACKFTHMGKISLEVLKTAQQRNRVELFFMVVDTGIGIDKTESDKLFKSFSQVDASISRKYGGTGLGLNISKQLVELMVGNISCESEKNKGTMFSFSIWVEVAEEDISDNETNIDVNPVHNLSDALGDDGQSNSQLFGTDENIAAIQNQLSKLILCIEMENWEKSEFFNESIKVLTADSPREIKTAALRLKMAVQKADYEKSINAYDILKHEIDKYINEKT